MNLNMEVPRNKRKKVFNCISRTRLAMIGMLTALISVAGPAAAVDSDLDGIDDAIDNCTLVANGTLLPVGESAISQRDTDGDNFGNVCDADLDQDLQTNNFDFSLFRTAWLTIGPDADFNGDGTVNNFDYAAFRKMYLSPPGPSCLSQPGACVVAAAPTARPDTYSTPFGKTLNVTASRISGVLHNDEDPQGQALTTVLVQNVANGALTLNADGSFTYAPGALTENQNDHFEYQARDTDGNLSQITRANIHIESNQSDYKIMMNYELGMHCTGFEFAYCCVLPVYNSILAQVVKPQGTNNAGYPELMEGDPNVGRDGLGRETVIRDTSRVGNNFRKFVVKYWHDAQPRQEGNGKLQNSTLISAVEGNSLQSWNTTFDSAMVVNGTLQYGGYNGADGVMLGNGILGEGTDNYQNSVWNHLYFYENLEGGNSTGTSLEADKIRLGVSGQPGPFPAVAYPADCGPAFHPMGPVTQGGDPANPTVANDCGGFSNGNVLTFSGDTGTVVFTQMKVLENLPIMLTSPRIWEALGLPLTTFEDTIDFFTDPGLVDEDSVRPFVSMKAQLHDYDPAAPGGAGTPTLNTDGTPVIGFGTAPIDIPNCERCHSNPANGSLIANSAAEGGGTLTVVNSPNDNPGVTAMVQQEYAFWNAFYGIDPAVESDWYSRLKSAAISILKGHDNDHGTSFAANYPGCGSATDPTDTTGCGAAPQLTRLGHEAVICARCHGQNVIAAVKGATCSASNPMCETDKLIMPISEALHYNHRSIAAGGVVAFADSQGRAGGCQGCHPAHRSDGNMNGYPITLAGANAQANSDNRDGSGGCFIGRDVHSNPGKDTDGAETPEHLNVVGQWLQTNVFSDPGSDGGDLGIWCTNCHNQLGQEIWKTENMTDLINGVGLTNPRGEPTMAALAAAVGTTPAQAISWLDPKNSNPSDDSFAIWAPDPGLCDYVSGAFGITPVTPAHDGNVATVEVNIGSGSGTCSNAADPNAFTVPVDCGFVSFDICGSTDGDGDFNVNLVGNTTPDAGGFGGAFCTTPDCVADAQLSLASTCTPAAGERCAVPVPFSAATDGRDHWLASGEPHCADCHAAPYVEQSGNIDGFPPFNYPRKASLMRYSRGHQDITCQGCHESIHGLYPVTPSIDNTTYAQAAALNHDGTHGPIKCGACHEVGADGIPTFINQEGRGAAIYGITDFDSAVTWAHTYTDQASPLDDTCQTCHGVQGPNWGDVDPNDETYMSHAMDDRGSRQMMDKAETALFGAPFSDAGNNPTNDNGTGGICGTCHGNEGNKVSCNDGEWLDHLVEGRVTASAFEAVSVFRTGATCW